jgi:hypothetical protein
MVLKSITSIMNSKLSSAFTIPNVIAAATITIAPKSAIEAL